MQLRKLFLFLLLLSGCSFNEEKYKIPELTYICRLDNKTAYITKDAVGDNMRLNRVKDFDYLCSSSTQFPVKENI